MGANDLHHVPASLYAGSRGSTNFTGGWLGPSVGMDRCGKCRPHWDLIHGPSRPYRIAIPTELTRPTYNVLSRTTRLRAEGTGVGTPVEVHDVSLFSNSEATSRRHPVFQSVSVGVLSRWATVGTCSLRLNTTYCLRQKYVQL